MATTHLYELIGASHTRGTPKSNEAGNRGPLILGPSEERLVLADAFAALGALAVGDIIQQAPIIGAPRARILVIEANNAVGATIVVEPVAQDVAGASTYTAGPIDDPVGGWDIFGTVNVNGSAITGQITTVERSQFAEQLNDRDLESVTTQTAFYDPDARLAQTLDVTGYTHTASTDYIQPGDRLSTSRPMTCIVVGIEITSASTARLFISRLTGTLTEGDTLVNDQANRAVAGVTIAAGGIGAATTAGRWVPYCATPSLGRSLQEATNPYIGNVWDIPPRGNASGSVKAGLGPDAKLVKNILAHHANAIDPTDRGGRLLTFSSNDAGSDGFRAGVTLQRLDVTSQTGTWSVGDTITASVTTTWRATVAATSGSGIILVTETNGVVLTSGEVLTSASGGTADSTGPALGWRKGSKFYTDWMAKRSAAIVADGALEGSAPIETSGLFAMIWEGEIAPFASIGDGPGLSLLNYYLANQTLMRKQWADWATEVRQDLGDVPITVWIHHAEAQPEVLTGAGLVPGVVSFLVRSLLKKVPTVVSKCTIVDSSERGHLMASKTLAGASTFFLRTLDYVDLGQALWSQMLEPTLHAPAGNFEVLPIIIVAASQSQMVAFNNYANWGPADKDPDLWPTAAFPGANGITDTRDPNLIVWNNAVRELQTYDVALNDNTFWRTENTNALSGPTVPIVQRFKMRFGDGVTSGKLGLFKAAVSGSCYSQNVKQAAGCWSPSLVARPALTATSITVTHVTVGSTRYARFTATAGFFDSVEHFQTITIEGSSGVQSGGGNNTPAFGFNSAVTTNGDDGSFVDIADPVDSIFADGTETLTIRLGPPPIWPELESQFKAFVQKVVQAGYIPHPIAIITEQGESDGEEAAAEYAANLNEVWTALVDLCSLRGSKKDQGIAKAIVQLHSGTPLVTATADIATIRTAQAAKASSLADCVVVDPSGLALEDSGNVVSSPPFPRLYREENGVHLTGRDQLTKGYLIDQRLGSLSGLIPSHPRGDVQLFGAINNGASLEPGDAPIDTPTTDGVAAAAAAATAGTSAAGTDGGLFDTLSTSDINGMLSGIQAAWSAGSDVFSYTVNGQTVTRNSPAQMIELHRYLLSIKQSTAGVRRTKARFV